MAGVKGKSGGKRPGAGRPCKSEGCPTKVMRVPSYMKNKIETLIRVKSEWLLLKTVDIRSPKTGISVHYSYSLLMAMQIY